MGTLSAVSLGWATRGLVTTISAQGTTVTLDNPGLEAPYPPFEGTGELKTASGWRPWWAEDTRRPEYLPDSDHIHNGELGQKQFTTFDTVDAGLFQEVDVTPGQWYRFTAWVLMQSTGDSGDLSAMVCVNPWARWDIAHRTTVCGMEITRTYGEWVQVEVTAQAFTDKMTVAARGVAKWPVAYNDFFWDDLTLQAVTVGGTCPTPAPVPTVAPCPTREPGTCQGATLAEIEALLRGMEWGVR